MTSSGGVSEKVMEQWFQAAGCNFMSRPDVKTLQRLLDEHKGKLDINATNKATSFYQGGWTALGWAAGGGHAEVIAFLLQRGADVNKCSSKNQNSRPLWDAAFRGHTKAVGALIAGGAKVNEATDDDADRPTALHAAAAKSHVDIVRLLLESGDRRQLPEQGRQDGCRRRCRAEEGPHRGRVQGVREQARTRREARRYNHCVLRLCNVAGAVSESKGDAAALAKAETARADGEKQRADREAARAAAAESALAE
jgi:ankyrin repeat protein